MRTDYRLLCLVLLVFSAALGTASDLLIVCRQGATSGEQLRITDGFRLGQSEEKAATDEIIPPELAPFFFAPLDVNDSTVLQLTTIKGIGTVTAEAIVTYRQNRGAICSGTELQRVPGIGVQRAVNLSKYLAFRSGCE